ncbi:MAG: EamA family transporter [Anaerolineales bacterium]|nr:EamA family transporter [Anaerolineales bacterium]
MNSRLIAVIQTLIVLLLMSFGTILTKIVLASIPPLTFAWTSIAVGMVVMAVYTFIIRKERVPKGIGKQVWWFIIAIGLCNFTISRMTRPIAIERLPVVTNTYVGNFIGIVTMVMSIFILKEIPSIIQVFGAAIAIVGITIYFDDPLQSTEIIGILMIIIGIVAVAYTNNIARKLAIVTENQLSNNIVSTIALLIGGSIAVVIGLIFDFPPKVPDLKSWGIILYAGVINISIGLTVWNHILRALRSYEASILGATTIIWTSLMAIWILHEQLDANQWVGMGLLLFGLILVQVRKGKLSDLHRFIKS